MQKNNLLIALSLSTSLLALPVYAADNAAPAKPAAPATQPAGKPPMPAMQNSPMMHPGAQPMAGSPPHGPGGPAAPTNMMNELNLTEEQKQKMIDWRKLQQQHMQDTLATQEKLEALASADKPDNAAIKALADKSGSDTQKYYLDYADKNHAFISSLTPEQRKKMDEFQKQRKEQMQQMRDRMKQQMNGAAPTPAAGAAPAPAASIPAPAAPKQ